MSATSIAVAVEGALIALLVLFVVALLRSHAAILRRLAALDGATAPPPESGLPMTSSESSPVTDDLVGQTLSGDAVKISLSGGAPRTLLAFLSSGCSACGALWGSLDDAPMPAGTRVLVVAKEPESESLARLRALAPERHEVILSSRAWRDFAIPATPHFVLIDGSAGRVVGRGAAASWQQILTLLSDAEQDTAAADGEDSSGRALRAEQALAQAGLGAGHASLYPSRQAAPEAPAGREGRT